MRPSGSTFSAVTCCKRYDRFRSLSGRSVAHPPPHPEPRSYRILTNVNTSFAKAGWFVQVGVPVLPDGTSRAVLSSLKKPRPPHRRCASPQTAAMTTRTSVSLNAFGNLVFNVIQPVQSRHRNSSHLPIGCAFPATVQARHDARVHLQEQATARAVPRHHPHATIAGPV